MPLIAMDRRAAETLGPQTPVGGEAVEEIAARDLRRRLARRGEGRRREARDERGGKMTRPILPKQSDGDACRLFFLTRGRLDLDIGAEAERGEQLDDLLE